MSETQERGWLEPHSQTPLDELPPLGEPGRVVFDTRTGKTIPAEWAPLIVQWLHEYEPVMFGRAVLAVLQVQGAAAKRGPKPQQRTDGG